MSRLREFEDPGLRDRAGRSDLVGRDRELGVVTGVLERVGKLPQVVLIEGEPGVGKTALLRAVVAAARGQGYRVLATTAARSEARISYAGLRDLLEHIFDEVAIHLPGPQRHALEVALLRREAGDQGVASGAVAAAGLGALRILAVIGPVMLAVDDHQWLDPSSGAVLTYIFRRLADERLVAVATVRSEPRVAVALPIAAAVPEPRFCRIELSPLRQADLEVILRARLQVALPHTVAARIHEASGGNPFYALELGRTLLHRGITDRPDQQLPMSPELEELVGKRLEALPATVARVPLVVAALGRPTISIVERVLGDTGSDAIDAAVAAGVVEVEADRLAPSHPILATVAYSRAGPAKRRRLHQELAAVLSESEGRARHRALSVEGTDPEVAKEMEAEAQTVFARGAPRAAVELSHQAIRLTPADKAGDMRRRIGVAAEHTFVAGDTDQALAMIRSLVEISPPGERASLLAQLARIEHFGENLDTAASTYRRALAETSLDSLVEAGAREGLAWCLLLMRDPLDEAVEQAQAAVEAALRGHDQAARAEGLAVKSLAQLLLGRPEAASTMAAALELEPSTEHLRVMRRPSFAQAYLLTRIDDFDGARLCLHRLMQAAAERGDESAEPSLRVHLAMVEWLAGDWDEARRHVQRGIETARHLSQRPSHAALLSIGAMVEVHADEDETGREMAEAALELAGGRDRAPRGGGEVALWALGCRDLLRGDLAGAADWLGPMVELFSAARISEPGELRFLSDYLETLVGLGRIDEVKERLVAYEATAERLARPSAKALSSQIRGLVYAHQGDLGQAENALQEAVGYHQRSPIPLDQSRTLLHLGRIQRRQKHRGAARITLNLAMDVFQELGANPWMTVTHEELARISGRQPGKGTLTPSELQVAELVAQGMSNKEVAAALFITRKTVETLLQRIYAKAGIHSRTKLPLWLAQEQQRLTTD